MNIIRDYRIFKQYFEANSQGYTRQLSRINEIIIHGSGGPDTAKGIINWMASGGQLRDGTNRIEKYKHGIGMFHYEIDFDGDIYQLVPLTITVFHSLSGKHDWNTVGIEMVSSDPKSNNSTPYTINQYNSLLDLCKYIMTQCPIRLIAGHSATSYKYRGKPKPPPPCPGNFDWGILENNFSLSMIEPERYELAA